LKSGVDIIAFARQALELSEDLSIDLSPLQGRGSDRSFFRVSWSGDHSAMLIHYDPKRIENACYADLAVFLHEIDVAVPRVIRHDPDRCLILMQDLGDTDLWSFREAPWEFRRTLYQKTLSLVHRLHFFPEKDFPSLRAKLMEGFGPDLYRWEQDYFRDHFVSGVCGIQLEPSFDREFQAELSGLAERLMETKRCLIHRDLQSQNVMVWEGAPHLIDFQGMRFGSPFYDIGSLLCDPYVRLSDEQRLDLLSFYYGLSERDIDWSLFQARFWEASSQRLMQALGAYGFLGLKKGLKPFLDHIPSGLDHLRGSATRVPSLPRLQELVLSCQKLIRQRR
jgi:N-acetylmuramate 1-kinase